MVCRLIKTDAYFDGEVIHRNGPYLIEIAGGIFRGIYTENAITPRLEHETSVVLNTPFLMLGLVDAHAHIFLDGSELNF